MSDNSPTTPPPAPRRRSDDGASGTPPPAPAKRKRPESPRPEAAPVTDVPAPAEDVAPVAPPSPPRRERPAAEPPAAPARRRDVFDDVPAELDDEFDDLDDLDEPAAPVRVRDAFDDEPAPRQRARDAFDDDLDDDDGDGGFMVRRNRPVATHVSGTMIVVGAKAGGVGKSSSAAHIAEMAAMQGFRTICIDEKSQGDLRKRLGFDDSRTLWQIARFWDGSPDTIGEWIVNSPDTKTDWIVGPDSAPEDYDDDLIPDELLGHLVDVLLDQYEIVVVDTHPAKKQATSIYYTQWIPRLVRDPRHAAVVVSEWDRAKLNSAVDWVTGLVNAGVDPSRTFFMGMLPQGGASGALSYENVARRFTMVRTLEPIPFSQTVKDANNGLGDTPMGGWRDPAYKAAIRAALYDILGDSRFAPEPEQKKWWQRILGGGD